jgi:hypothetical protein
MLDLKPLNRILFLDIETTSQKANFSELTQHQQELFLKRFKKDFESAVELKYKEHLLQSASKKAEVVQPENEASTKKKSTKKKVEESSDNKVIDEIKLKVASELYNVKAPIFPEFGRILCISIGVMWKNKEDDDFYYIKIITFSNEDEKTLLIDFMNHPKLGPILNKVAGKFDKNQSDFWALCAHNGRVFDFPFIAKRMIVHGFKLPAMFDYAHLKPWEQNHIIDTKESWSFGIWDAAVSLDLLSDIFNVASSKDDIDGSQVKDIFWVENDLPRISIYCEKDVVALATNYLRMKSMTEEVVVFQPAPVNQEEPKEESAEKQDEQSEG